MKKLVFLTTIIALFLCSCAKTTTTELTAEQKATIEKEVRDQYDGLVSTLNQLDINPWYEYWSQDQFISMNSGVNYFPKLSVWTDSVSYWLSKRERQQVELVEVHANALTSELVILISKANWDVMFKSEEHLIFRAVVSLLWKKEETGWKIIAGHESWQPIEETIRHIVLCY
ncbi:MAG: hypothetical protein E4H14_19220 [Candidatus Thorarchaeota archaeon]|nr:MAG: hypothetical protein E4H14_19220 [Candidatus Thorarchaeota archaeon]